jgi:hypothetical protein
VPTSLERKSSKSHVESSHPQGVVPTSLERESSKLHVESSHPQGVVPTSLERESSKSHVESQVRSATGSSEALVLVSRKRPTASRGRTHALSAEAAQARKGPGKARWGSGAAGAARNSGWQLLASCATGIGASSCGVEMGV